MIETKESALTIPMVFNPWNKMIENLRNLISEKLKELVTESSRNNDEFCAFCDGRLEAIEKFPFSFGIFYKCEECGRIYRKIRYKEIGKEVYFFLIEVNSQGISKENFAS